jgi:hypothetical protein
MISMKDKSSIYSSHEHLTKGVHAMGGDHMTAAQTCACANDQSVAMLPQFN